MVTPHLPWKFHANRSSRFLVMGRYDRIAASRGLSELTANVVDVTTVEQDRVPMDRSRRSRRRYVPCVFVWRECTCGAVWYQWLMSLSDAWWPPFYTDAPIMVLLTLPKRTENVLRLPKCFTIIGNRGRCVSSGVVRVARKLPFLRMWPKINESVVISQTFGTFIGNWCRREERWQQIIGLEVEITPFLHKTAINPFQSSKFLTLTGNLGRRIQRLCRSFSRQLDNCRFCACEVKMSQVWPKNKWNVIKSPKFRYSLLW